MIQRSSRHTRLRTPHRRGAAARACGSCTAPPIARQSGQRPSWRLCLAMCLSTNRQPAWRANEPLASKAEGKEVAMARTVTYLLVMAVVGISMLLGYPAVALGQGVTSERLLHADQEPHNWLMYYGNYQGWRYSPLQQINTTNLQRLAVKWTFRTGSGDEN